MPISFTCPHCGRFTEVDDQYAGQSGPCAGCGQTVTIPSKLASGPFKPGGSAQRGRRSSSGTNTALIVAIVLGAMCLCGGPILIALLLPAVQSAREAARRAQCTNNLKQIGLAMHNYHDVHRCFPAGFVADEAGQPMHSWRVALLPFLERADLYDQYNFDEPWNSPNNMLVAEQMPEVFRCPSAPSSGPGSNVTNYVVVLDDNPQENQLKSVFSGNRWTRIREIRDGTSNTLLVVEVQEPVPWTQPDGDLQFSRLNLQISGGPNSIGAYHPGGANVLFADGSVRFLSSSLDHQTLRLMIQPADGQALPGF